MTVTRGTSNGNESGSSYDRRKRRAWLLEVYRSDRDLYTGIQEWTKGERFFWPADDDWFDYSGRGSLDYRREPTCRCYRCGDLLTITTLTVDRIVPGCLGGTYRRNNIRPACGPCNSITGNTLQATRRKGKR